MKKYFLTAAFIPMLGMSLKASAEAKVIAGTDIIQKYQQNNSTMLILGIAILVLLFIVIILTLDVRKMASILRQQNAAAAEGTKVVRSSWWQLFRMKVKKDSLEEGHEYDGIQEYDNNPPAWFNWLFYGSIAFAVVYMLFFHVFNLGTLQAEQYANQMKEAEVLMAKAQEKAIELSEKPPFTDAANLEIGKGVFTTNCAACHGPEGQGGIGPNLTDEYWLHGGSYKDVFKTIFNGVPEKGMLSWKKSLRPDEIRAVSSFVYKLRGTKPANPKAPQGDKYMGEATADNSVPDENMN